MTNTSLELPAYLDHAKFIFDQTHDLRSPFNQVVGFNQVLLNDCCYDKSCQGSSWPWRNVSIVRRK